MFAKVKILAEEGKRVLLYMLPNRRLQTSYLMHVAGHSGYKVIAVYKYFYMGNKGNNIGYEQNFII